MKKYFRYTKKILTYVVIADSYKQAAAAAASTALLNCSHSAKLAWPLTTRANWARALWSYW